MFRISNFENILEKATSNLLLEPDWNAIMQICDMIRQKDIMPKTAIQLIRKKLFSTNPNVVIYTLQVLESVVKNCGKSIYQEIATKEFMTDMKDVYNDHSNEQIKQKVLELIQIWSHAFRDEPKYSIVKDTYIMMKLVGYNFPILKESDAMFMTETPPDWVDGETCNNCKTTFTLVQRKHHCRCCGQIFCQKCSSKSSIIPKFGIEREVRVCDECFAINNKHNETAEARKRHQHQDGSADRDRSPSLYDSDEDYEHYDTIPSNNTAKTHSIMARPLKESTGANAKNDNLPLEYINSPLSKQSQQPPLKTEQEEKEEIELALALSASEAESNLAKAAKNSKYLYLGVGPTGVMESSKQPQRNPVVQQTQNYYTSVENDMENELARYLDRDYWEQKQKQLNMKLTAQPDSGYINSNNNNINSNFIGTTPTAPDAMTNTNSHPSPSPSLISGFLPPPTPSLIIDNSSAINSGSKNMNQQLGNSSYGQKLPGSQLPPTGAFFQANNPTATSSQFQQIEEFSGALQNGINIFVKRMQSNASRNRSIVNDSSVQTLFVTLSQLQPKLLEQIRGQEDRRNQLETMQDKISQLKDARAALTALREDYRERERKEAEAVEAKKKQQMAEKLELMRQKKQEYLDLQRQITFQRLSAQQQGSLGSAFYHNPNPHAMLGNNQSFQPAPQNFTNFIGSGQNYGAAMGNNPNMGPAPQTNIAPMANSWNSMPTQQLHPHYNDGQQVYFDGTVNAPTNNNACSIVPGKEPTSSQPPGSYIPPPGPPAHNYYGAPQHYYQPASSNFSSNSGPLDQTGRQSYMPPYASNNAFMGPVFNMQGMQHSLPPKGQDNIIQSNYQASYVPTGGPSALNMELNNQSAQMISSQIGNYNAVNDANIKAPTTITENKAVGAGNVDISAKKNEPDEVQLISFD